MVLAEWMEKMMNTERELTEAELDAVSGGTAIDGISMLVAVTCEKTSPNNELPLRGTPYSW
jgi:hypothetical protein